MRIRLLGAPVLVDDEGRQVHLRGQKPWALLGRILLADRPLTRRELSRELFTEADDPLGALRWTLASIRKAVGAETFAGDPVLPGLPDSVTVDVLRLRDGELDDDALGEFLDGIDPSGGPEFSTWLLVARRQVAGEVDALLHDRTVRALAGGRVADAVRLAELAARRNPYDERYHVLLAKALVAAGHDGAARQHVEEVAALFERELGATISPALRAAAQAQPDRRAMSVSPSAQAEALIEAGRSALAAGAPDAGVDCLRQAMDAADRHGDTGLVARVALELGTALVHAVRGFDDEGSVLLERAATIAEELGDAVTACNARRERGYVKALAGRRADAQRQLELAAVAAGSDAGLLAGVDAVAGLNLADWGRFEESAACFGRALDLAASAGDRRRRCWVLGVGAWGRLQQGDVAGAAAWSNECIDLVRELRWLSFEPWPVAVALECDMVRGDAPPVAAIERCFATACHLGDPCWEGAAARLLSMHQLADGAATAGVEWITDAERRVRRRSDTWAAMVGAVLTTAAEAHLQADDPEAAESAARAAVEFTARTSLDGQLRRAVDLMDRARR